ncbi:ParA family protein [Actinomadura sp. WAC 06369]|uniref:ParA family protein n=1 Tax=Actinomadura sp. WAC 06369 TaxID=2203193 RepID=UPI000F776C9F|nr:ParA family protein [Actinomadura sp. WAC 06369]RSN51118.1 ParA family protein [Actinomadura sp. WAC 06369]
MTDQSLADPETQAEDDRLARVIAIANDKGGVGKTSTTANLAALYAAAGYKVLAIDLNRQANLSDDLGYRDATEDDQGIALLNSLQHGRPLSPVAIPSRPGLHVVPGGTALTDLTAIVLAQMGRHGTKALMTLANALEEIAAEYDLVLIDTPPENTTLVDLALRAARWLIMPTKSDAGGLVGMRLLAERFQAAQESNPRLGLLGVVLFATTRGRRDEDGNPQQTAIQRGVREKVEAAFGSSPVLAATIGHSERIAVAARDHGRVAHELESDAASQPAWWESLRSGTRNGPRIPPTAGNVAEDYRKLAAEILDLLAAAEGQA